MKQEQSETEHSKVHSETEHSKRKAGHSKKTMWGCAALVLLAVILAFATNAYVLLFVIPCMLMMGAMMWMMMGGIGGGKRGGEQK